MDIKKELPLLMAKAETIGTRLDLLSRRISNLQHESSTTRQIAVVDPKRCLGCGKCANQCPQGAIVLRPYEASGTQVSRRNVAKA